MAAQAAPAPADDLIEVTVDGKPVKVPKGSNVLQACDAAGVDVPRFCYHQRLSIAGNCRMCLVEVEKSPKPVASCAMPAGPGMNIKTSTPLVKKAREGVMEFLLINHPLDCPICDQGGECDLQDQAMAFGSDRSRFTEVKRAVVDKNLGPLVKTVMTRCIHCTRCVRFAKEVAGVEDLGMTGRGRDSEIGTYVERMLTSELSANVIDLCPVGALTAKPSAFTFRNWELASTESVDVSDALGSAIRVDARGPEVFRVTPRLNDAINQEWISDKARFQVDALRLQRLSQPLVRGAGGGLEPATWPRALAAAAEGLARARGHELRGVAGRLADVESVVALKDLLNRLGLAGVDGADSVLLVGTDPRAEAPVLNARLRALALAGVPFASIGAPLDLTFPLLAAGDVVREGWNGFAVLADAAGTVGALDLGFVPGAGARGVAPRAVYLLGADDYEEGDVPADAFVVYQGHHGERGAARADVVLPGAAYTEKFGTYVNAEGRAQSTKAAVGPPGAARDDWKVLRALSEVMGAPLPYDTLAGVRARLAEVAPHLARRGALEPPLWLGADALGVGGAAGKPAADPLATRVTNFYQTDAISRASKTMARCVRARQNPVPGL
ncbi:NADH dehydrogenase [ubiquinone] iron-sulfur protein 1, mitochondrial [Auxenochlorella protothecoides]|uniref:NADH dehydrogenase [ubiquinone] iron-sulfur protein 1, mitochondrial n=1 Tax=Auxenochlorella protothecoides TaxID=3075 RepID=A0A087SCI3_AUXPR|nr:NADH dehydrogenase [ubiquinone] iron-sulfur protein 1, mitochondrial [Auxenochlorella protothecoides]KFM23437.1 NADH dehydrogenase [ubiquinone] iron-sulfur protein 1, mitochondrial [Auxenochlorella protothecoides]